MRIRHACAQTAAADTASQSLDLARRSYAAGNSGILDVLDAQRRNAQAQLGLARARSQRLMDTVQLYLALGGSAIAPPPAKPDDAKNEWSLSERRHHAPAKASPLAAGPQPRPATIPSWF